MRIHNFFLQNGNDRLVSKVRLLLDEGIPIQEVWRQNLLQLSGEEEYRSELHQLLGEMQDQAPKNKNTGQDMTGFKRYIMPIMKRERSQKTKGTMPVTEKKSVQSKEMQNMAEKYFELLKNGDIECRDLTDETLSEMILFAGDKIKLLPVSVQGELIYRKLIPLDLSGLDIQQQLKLLMRDEWYGLSPAEIGNLLKDSWKDFTPDMLLGILTYHPAAFEQWPGWDWSAVADGSPAAWCSLLKRHHCYANHCPAETWSGFSFEERFSLAAESPGLAARLELPSLPAQMQDAFLYENPLLAGCFNFAHDDPPGVLSLRFDYEKCYKEEVNATAEFLKKLLPFTYGYGMTAYNHLGIFSRTRGSVLQEQSRTFLKNNYIPETSIYVEWNELHLPLIVPVDNLEAQILLHSSCVAEACMEGEKLSRIDILLTPAFERMRMDWSCLVLYMALSPELRREALEAMEKKGSPAWLVELVKNAVCGKNSTRSQMEEQLLYALEAKDLSVLNGAVNRVYISSLSADEALKICRTHKAPGVQKFFNLFLTPALRARLITELIEPENKRENVKLINVLLRPCFREYLHEEFEVFQAEDL